MIKEKSFLNLPIPFSHNVSIYPPTISQVVTNEKFFNYKKILTITQEEIDDIYAEKDPLGPLVPIDAQDLQEPNLTPLEFILNNCYHDKQFLIEIQKAFQFFCKQPVSMLYELKSILIGDVEKELLTINDIQDLSTKVTLLNEENFIDFQNVVRIAVGDNPVEITDEKLSPRIRQMKAKARYRDRIKAKKGDGITFNDSLISICCLGIGITPLNVGEVGYSTLYKILDRYQAKERYDIDIKSLLAGADSKKIKPKYWMINQED